MISFSNNTVFALSHVSYNVSPILRLGILSRLYWFLNLVHPCIRSKADSVEKSSILESVQWSVWKNVEGTFVFKILGRPSMRVVLCYDVFDDNKNSDINIRRWKQLIVCTFLAERGYSVTKISVHIIGYINIQSLLQSLIATLTWS